MPAYIGSQKIVKCYLGTQEIDKVMLGTHEVCSSALPNVPPVAAFTFIANDLAVQFHSTSHDPDGTIASYAWDFGDGHTSTVQNPTHTYAAAGTHNVSLTVTDNGGLTRHVTHSVAVTLSCTPLPADAANFIAKYESSEEQALIAENPNGLYPMGPNMVLAWYSPDTPAKPGVPNPFDVILDNGLTLAGPNYGNGWGEAPGAAPVNCQWARDHNKKVFVHIRPTGGGTSTVQWSELNARLSTQGGRDAVYDFIVARIASFVSLWDDVVEGWSIGPDDAVGEHSVYYGIVKNAVIAADPKKRPFIAVPRSDSAITVNRSNANAGMPILSQQLYIIRNNNYTYAGFSFNNMGCDGGVNWPLSPSASELNKAQYRGVVSFFITKFKEWNSAAGSAYTGRPRTSLMLLQDYDDIYVDGRIHEHDYALAQKWQKHDFWAALAAGADGVNYYSNGYYSASNGGEYTLVKQNETIRHQFGVVSGLKGEGRNLSESEVSTRVRNSLQRALLWGDDSPNGRALSFNITNSARVDTPMGWGPTQDPPTANRSCRSKTWYTRDIQHGLNRFIVCVNSHPVDTVNYTMSGIPHMGLKMTNLLTGADVDISSGSLSESIQSLDVRVYKIEVDDGFCGGDVPQPAPAITIDPVGGTFHVGDATPVFTVGYTPPAASVQWQWQHVGSGVAWGDISGATADTYHMSKTHIESGHDGDEFRAKVTTSGNPPVYSHTAHISVVT